MANKIAVITGTSSGFGLFTAVELARQGFEVVATMRDLGRRSYLEEAAARAGVGAKIDVRKLDVTEFDRIPIFVAEVLGDYKRIDVLVNNAGFAMAGFAEDLQLEEIRLQFETNFFGAVAMTKAVLPAMRAQKSGHVIMLSSVGGQHGSPVISSYSASKHALEGWSESLRLEVGSLGIKVVLIEPGAFQTDMFSHCAGSWQHQEPERAQTWFNASDPAGEVRWARGALASLDHRRRGQSLRTSQEYARHLTSESHQHGDDDQAGQSQAGDKGEGALHGVDVKVLVVTMLDVHERPHGNLLWAARFKPGPSSSPPKF